MKFDENNEKKYKIKESQCRSEIEADNTKYQMLGFKIKINFSAR